MMVLASGCVDVGQRVLCLVCRPPPASRYRQEIDIHVKCVNRSVSWECARRCLTVDMTRKAAKQMQERHIALCS